MQMASSSSRTLYHVFALCSAVAAYLLLAACGDDGTDGLSSCPEGKIQPDKFGVQRCVPRAGSGGATPRSGTGGATPATPRGGMGSSQQPSAGNPAANGGAGAANSGGATLPVGAPPIPKGGTWTCVQVSSACSCTMTAMELDTCMKPLPTCCALALTSGGQYSGCICYPETSVECSRAKREPMNFVSVSTCPPQ